MMPRPHDETWEAKPESDDGEPTWKVLGTNVGPGRRVISDTVEEPYARLIAQAPAMARLLLALEWAGSSEDGSRCPSCLADAYVPPALYDADGKYLGYTPGKHDEDCDLAAVLRAAGVLPATH